MNTAEKAAPPKLPWLNLTTATPPSLNAPAARRYGASPEPPVNRTTPLQRYYLLFSIDVTTREVFFAGITAKPTRAWTTQAARNLFLRHGHKLAANRTLVRDQASQFIASFDEIFRTEDMKILKTPVRTPVANTFAERWIGSLRRELLDRTIIWNRRQLERLVTDYIEHHNKHRPHRSLQQPNHPNPNRISQLHHHAYPSSNQPAATG